eukprot:TRINITY_DN8379_c0_g1_i2.p1 TRINITY_DN8379_c0_g1~~TRINITY_DN8379_c0_g1_i2.p1  ORF type:complete len:206 (+),score=20.87 TRINITY_DN8379_c0_g1_i2:408-1025(+)
MEMPLLEVCGGKRKMHRIASYGDKLSDKVSKHLAIKRSNLLSKVSHKLDISYDQKKSNEFEPERVTMQTPKSKQYCKKCRRHKPPRTHHCGQCDRCIVRMDHHCPWLGNCVGFDNHKYFFLFLCYYSLFTVYTATCLAVTLVKAKQVRLIWSVDWGASLYVFAVHNSILPVVPIHGLPDCFPRLLAGTQYHDTGAKQKRILRITT